jgi:hypothetical protein
MFLVYIKMISVSFSGFILTLKFISLCLNATSGGTDYARSSNTRILFWSLQFTTQNNLGLTKLTMKLLQDG